MTVTSANHTIMAEMNRRSTVELIREHGSLSRLELSRLTGLRGSTVTHIVRELMASQLLRSVGKRSASRVGPKEIILQINPDYGFSVGIELAPDYAQLVILDAACNLVTGGFLDSACELSRCPTALKALLDRKRRELKLPGRLLGVGLAVPGIVDTRRGVILNSMVYKVRNYPLGEQFAAAFETNTTLVDHNVNFAALAEMRLGAAKGIENFIHFFIGQRPTRNKPTFRAYSTSLVMNGAILHGTNFAAGEIDEYLRPHIEFQPDQAELNCLQQVEQPLTPQLQALALAIGKLLASLVNFLDPQAAVISSNQPIANRLFLALIREETLRLLTPIENRNFSIHMSTLDQLATATGAALAVADATFAAI